MSRLVQRIHDIGLIAWLRFVQALNGILVTLLGAALVVHQTYPGLIAQMVGKLPPIIGVPVIIAVGVLIHFALRQAKKSA